MSLVFGITENGRVSAPNSSPSIASGAMVHQCTDRDLTLPFPNPLTPFPYETKDHRKVKS